MSKNWLVSVNHVATRLGRDLAAPFGSRILPFRHRDGFIGANYRGIRRGRGYAIICMTPEALSDAMDDIAVVVNGIRDTLHEAAAALGEELVDHLQGVGTQRGFIDALEDARKTGLGVAVEGISPAPAGQRWFFYHLGALPHLVVDDGMAALRDDREQTQDNILLKVRFFGNVVPGEYQP